MQLWIGATLLDSSKSKAQWQLVEEVGIEQTGTNTTIIKPQNQGPPPPGRAGNGKPSLQTAEQVGFTESMLKLDIPPRGQ